MPRLSRLADDGVRFTKHHSVFPTVTRVNASSIATGAYPERHGLLGNAVFFPRVDPKAGLDTSNRDHLLRIQESEARLLDVPDLGSIFGAEGRTVLVASSGSTGSAYLLNHRAGSAGTKGGILHTEYTSPPELHARVVERLGAPPPAAEPDAGRNRWIVDALLEVGLDQFRPDVVILWLSDPDSTAHERGIGAPQSEDALRRVDAELGRLLDELARRGLRTNVFVTSDHGFSTHRGAPDVGSIFAKFRGTTADGEPDLVFAGQAVYDRTGSPERVRRMVEALQAQTGVGALFTAPASPGDLRGSVPGTLSFDAAQMGTSTRRRHPHLPRLVGRQERARLARHERLHRCRRPRLERPLGHSRHTHRRRSRPASGRRIAMAQRQRRPRAHSVSTGRDRGAGVDARPRPRRGARQPARRRRTAIPPPASCASRTRWARSATRSAATSARWRDRATSTTRWWSARRRVDHRSPAFPSEVEPGSTATPTR